MHIHTQRQSQNSYKCPHIWWSTEVDQSKSVLHASKRLKSASDEFTFRSTISYHPYLSYFCSQRTRIETSSSLSHVAQHPCRLAVLRSWASSPLVAWYLFPKMRSEGPRWELRKVERRRVAMLRRRCKKLSGYCSKLYQCGRHHMQMIRL